MAELYPDRTKERLFFHVYHLYRGIRILTRLSPVKTFVVTQFSSSEVELIDDKCTMPFIGEESGDEFS